LTYLRVGLKKESPQFHIRIFEALLEGLLSHVIRALECRSFPRFISWLWPIVSARLLLLDRV